MESTATLRATSYEGNSLTTLDGYHVSEHAQQRMIQRCVPPQDVRAVLQSSTVICEVDSAGISQYRGVIGSRPIRVTINEITNVIVTVAAPARSSLNSDYDWFSIGTALEHRV